MLDKLDNWPSLTTDPDWELTVLKKKYFFLQYFFDVNTSDFSNLDYIEHNPDVVLWQRSICFLYLCEILTVLLK